MAAQSNFAVGEPAEDDEVDAALRDALTRRHQGLTAPSLVEGDRSVVILQHPDREARETGARQRPPGGVEQLRAESEALVFREQIEFVYLALERQLPHAAAAVGGIADRPSGH